MLQLLRDYLDILRSDINFRSDVTPITTMGSTENFCLRWNDYEKKYAETFRTLREDEHFADVTLACEGHAVKAHRIILCACSGYFGHILRTINPAQVCVST